MLNIEGHDFFLTSQIPRLICLSIVDILIASFIYHLLSQYERFQQEEIGNRIWIILGVC